MAKPEWGTKRTCQSCGVSFYDMKRKAPECPKCGAVFNPEPVAKPRRPVPVAEEKPAPEKAKEPIPDDDDTKPDDDDTAAGAGAESDGVDDEEDEDLIEDASDLGEDDDDMSEVKEHIDDGVGDKA